MIEAPTPKKEAAPVFEVITVARIEELKEGLTERTGVDFRELPVDVVRQGDAIFDCLEAQIKLQQKVPWPTLEPLLLGRGYVFHAYDEDSAAVIRAIAEEQGVEMDGKLPGFAYNLGGQHIVYLCPPEDHAATLAASYAKKEGVEEGVVPENAQPFLKDLAEKYFFHEVGHTVHLSLLNDNARKWWDDFVFSFPDLVERVREVQKDKFPDPSMVRVSDEAFADLFGAEVAYGKGKSRLGSHPDAEEGLQLLLKHYGFSL